MINTAVLGATFGDEGKGRIVHHFSPNYDWVIRVSGGSNAGHTIYRTDPSGNLKKYVHNLLPSFDWRVPGLKCFLGSGMVIDLEQLYNEIETINRELSYGDYDYYSISDRVYVDPDAFVVLPEHKEEDEKTNGHIGSTNRGIGPAYKSKVGRCGTRIRDLLNKECVYNEIPGHELQDNNIRFKNRLLHRGVQFKSVLELKDEFKNSKLLFEGAQGILLDLNHGIYPYVSCGDSTVAGIYSCGFSFLDNVVSKVYGVTKCYATKVGEGPFPTEIFGEEAEVLRKVGNEYGATTGRPRRIGWLDLPALRYACAKGGIDAIIMTKLDILDGVDEIKVCYEYEKEPVCSADFFNAKPKYINLPGWRNSKNKEEVLPFINKVNEMIGCKVEIISCGVSEKDIRYI